MEEGLLIGSECLACCNVSLVFVGDVGVVGLLLFVRVGRLVCSCRDDPIGMVQGRTLAVV